jgi:hypothetical protein
MLKSNFEPHERSGPFLARFVAALFKIGIEYRSDEDDFIWCQRVACKVNIPVCFPGVRHGLALE